MRGCRVLRYSSWSGATLGATLGACVPYPPGQGAPTPPSGLGFYGTPACDHGIHRHVWSHQIDCGSGTSIGPLDDSLNMPKVLEVGLGALGTLAAVVVMLMALRMAPKLSLSAHRLAVRIFVAAVLFVVASALVGVSVAFTRPSTLADAAGEFAELVTICCVGFALRVINRAEREEISPLRHSVNTDDLTGLSSRSYFQRAAARRIQLSQKSDMPLTCIVLDVDDFKAYNDSHGHEAGDRALSCVARVLGESVRADDLVARYGGEEFVMLVSGDVQCAVEIAERVRRRVACECVPEHDASLARPITVSLGVVPLTEETPTLERLVQAADTEMYRAKGAGKNRVSVFGGM